MKWLNLKTIKQNSLSRIIIVLLVLVLIQTVVICCFCFSRDENSVKVQTTSTELGLKNIGELVTQAGYYTNVQSISNSRELFGLEVPFTQSKYIFSYDGIIKAGFDFSQLDLAVDEANQRITVTMPAVRILSNEIDENSLMVFDEQNNIFSPLKLDSIKQSRIEMKANAEATAMNNGLFDSATLNAQTLIRAMFNSSTDLSDYEIQFISAADLPSAEEGL